MYQVIPCVNFLIKDKEGRVLFGQRENREGKIYRGLWDIPGGRIEDGESIIDAIKRELKEETNFNLKSAKLLDIFHHSGTNIEGSPGIIILFEVQVSGDISANDDITNLKWLTYKQIETLKLTPWAEAFKYYFG